MQKRAEWSHAGAEKLTWAVLSAVEGRAAVHDASSSRGKPPAEASTAACQPCAPSDVSDLTCGTSPARARSSFHVGPGPVQRVRSSPKWTGFTRFYKTVICMGMHAFHGNGKGSRSAPAIQVILKPKNLLSGARLRSVLRTHCIRSAKSLLYRGAHAYKTRPESGHRFTPRLELHVHSAPLSK